MTAMFNYRAPVLRAELLSLLADHGGDRAGPGGRHRSARGPAQRTSPRPRWS